MEPQDTVKESTTELKWLVVMFILFYSINAVCFAIISTMTGMQWTQLTPSDRFIKVVGAVGSWTNTMMAFFSKSFARWSDGKSIINGNGRRGDTDLLKKGEVKP